MNTQNTNDHAFYFSICILRRLRDMGLLSAEEYTKICEISRDYYGSKIIVL